METAWQRVEVELRRRNKTRAWLAARLGGNKQRVYNWEKRGDIPPAAYAEVAAVLGKTIAWLTGEDQAPQPEDYSAMAMRLAMEFDRIEDPAAQAAAFAHCIGVISRASGSLPEAPRSPPSQPPSDGHPPGK